MKSLRFKVLTISLILLAVVIASIVGVFIYHASNKNNIEEGINSILAKFPEPLTIGIKVEALNNNRILYQKNANNTFVPASNLKLFTAAAALLYLGPTYQFQTTLLSNAQPANGVIDGEIYLEFSGDPDFTTRDLDLMLAQLHAQGVREITGNFYLDMSAYDDKVYGPGWMEDDLNYCYAAPVSALLLDHNCVNYTVVPGMAAGQPAKFILNPDQPRTALTFSNVSVSTQNPNTNCTLDTKVSNENDVTINGCVTLDTPQTNLPIAIKNPVLYTQHTLSELLELNGIQLNGRILTGKANGGTILVVHKSKPLSELVSEMLKQSDNLIANTLLKTVGATYYKQPGSFENGLKAEQAILTQAAKLNFTNSVIVDGDGQSRYNLISPDQISQLLNYVYHNFTIGSYFISALPIAGHDGTLQKRMQNADVVIRAKTGSMTGVSALSGFIETKGHKTLLFTILINNYNGSEKKFN